MIWIFSLSAGAVFSVLYAILGGLCGPELLLILPLFLGGTAAALILVVLFAMAVIAPIDVSKPIKKPSKFYFRLFELFNDFICTSARIRVVIGGKEKLNAGEKYLFVYNHRSNFDPMLISKCFKKYRILMISKPQNFKKFLAGKCIHRAGFMAINRENDREAAKTILKAIGYLGEGYSVAVAPEGTRNQSGIGLLPFRNGAFKIATKAKVPICVLNLNGTEKVKHNFPLKSTKVFIDIVSVITPEEYADMTTSEIGDIVAAKMTENIEKRNGVKIAENV